MSIMRSRHLWLICLPLLLSWKKPTKPLETPLAGIRTSDRFTPESLVQDIFVGGACKNISQIKSIGNKKGIGYFENGRNVIGIERGIVLSTGPIGNVAGPNEIGDEGGDFKDESGDSDLRRLTSASIFDAVGVEFDFVPLDSIVTFRYVFASEEYCEFVGTSFNDVFGFFVSGPGIQGPFSRGSTNVALTPGSNEYVSINTINHLKNSGLFVRNEPKRDADRCQMEWKQHPNLELIEYDGFTRVLTATLKLIPCETYHLRLVISDVSDGNYDSAVFLEAESFNIGGNINLSTRSTSGVDTLLEACNTGSFEVKRRPGEKTDQPLTIGLRIAKSSTATPGLDFVPLPKTITIPTGENQVVVPIQLLIDDTQEDVESIILELDFPCACISDTARFFIKDPPLLKSTLEDQAICIGAVADLRAGASGGVPPYTYTWSNGATTESFTVQLQKDSTFSLTITDACNRKRIRSARISRRSPPTASIAGNLEACQGDTLMLPVRMNGLPPFRFIYSIGNGKPDTLTNIPNNNYLLPIAQAGVVRIKYFADAACAGVAPDSAVIRHYTLSTITRTNNLSCAFADDGSIQVEVSGGIAPYSFSWKNMSATTPNLSNLPEGEYVLTIRDAKRCSATFPVKITSPPALQPVTFNCNDLRGSFILLSASGGSPPYSYSVDGKHFNSQIFEQLNPGQTYRLHTRDAKGCQIVQNFLMPSRYERMAEIEPSVKIGMGMRYTLNPKLNIPLSLVSKLEWSPADGLSCTDCLRPVLSALKNETYILKVTDVFGCSDGTSIIVKLDRNASVFIPNAFSPNGDGANDKIVIFADPAEVAVIRRMQIFNKWGQLVFDANDLAPNSEVGTWDGRYRGTLLEAGVFLYKAVLELTDGTLNPMEGTFLLMR
jgi:gliding motility-associated-like protein